MHNQSREPQPYEDCQEKSIQEFGVNFTRIGLRLGSRHQEPHTQTCRGIWLQLSSEGVLLGLRRRRTGLFLEWSKVLFSDESKFLLVLESGGRVETLIAQVA